MKTSRTPQVLEALAENMASKVQLRLRQVLGSGAFTG